MRRTDEQKSPKFFRATGVVSVSRPNLRLREVTDHSLVGWLRTARPVAEIASAGVSRPDGKTLFQ